jgi:hypothetical protein
MILVQLRIIHRSPLGRTIRVMGMIWVKAQAGLLQRPDFFNNVVNGFPAIRFNTASGSRLIGASFFTFPTNEISVLFVNNNTDAGDGLFSYASSAGSNDFLIFNSASTQVFVDETQVNFWCWL